MFSLETDDNGVMAGLDLDLEAEAEVEVANTFILDRFTPRDLPHHCGMSVDRCSFSFSITKL